jgi:hypothetical protein
MPDRPVAKTDGFVSEQPDSDIALYDAMTQRAHSLSGAAASV